MVDHVAVLGAGCIDVTLVVDHVPGFDAGSGQLLAHVAVFDAVSAPKCPWWSITWQCSARVASK
ncbi:MAG: hypothetical protein ACOX69_04070 [Coriobacteriales bacterium]